MTIHEDTIEKIQQYWRDNYGVEMKRRGMRKEAWKMYREIALSMLDDDGNPPSEGIIKYAFDGDFPRPGFNPDLYCVQKVMSTDTGIIRVTVIEVEDTSHLTPEKLYKLAWWWSCADCSDFIDAHCWACDRFGKSWRKLDLETMWYEWCIKDKYPPRQ